MSLTLGEKLRQAREARGISISEVAEATRISALYLESIENNDYRTLPGGIFNKGFVKSFAKFVGIDEQEALQDYAQLISEQGGGETIDEPKTYRPEVLTDEYASSSMLPTLLIAFVMLALLAGAIYFGVDYYQNSQNQTVANNTNANRNGNSSNSANTNTAAVVATPTPNTSEINVEFKTTEPFDLTYWLDGKMATKKLTPTDALVVKPQQSLKLRFFKGFSDRVQLMVNGKQITPPPPPAKGVGVEFEINKDNLAQILQSGAISAPVAPTTAPGGAPR